MDKRQVRTTVSNGSSGQGLPRLGLIFGGVGPEHEASLSSARAVADAVSGRYSLRCFGIAKDGRWLVGDGAWSYLYASAEHDLLPGEIKSVANTASSGFQLYDCLPPAAVFADVDCLFPLVHGTGGEDGGLQGLFSFLGKPFAGSGLLGSAQAYDKWTAKRLAAAAGIPTVAGILVAKHMDSRAVRAELRCFGYSDHVIKPAASGSSFGVSRVTGEGQLDAALANAFKYGHSALIEPYVENVELSVGVLGNVPRLVVSPPVSDHAMKNGLSTYHDKYIAEQAPATRPAELPKKVGQEAQELARAAFTALGCAGFARVDFFFVPASGRLYFNELNTIPALTPSCAFPTSMALAGYPYREMLDIIVDLAFERGTSGHVERFAQAAE